MKKIQQRLLFVTLLGVLALGLSAPFARAQATPVVISDGSFDAADWTIFKVTTVAGTSHTVQQAQASGNPSAFRSMTHTLPPVLPGVLAEIHVTHLYLGSSYDPGTQGAINHLDYAEDGVMLSLPWVDAHSITHLALVQANRLFLSNDFVSVIGNTAWQRDNLTNLTASDFSADDGSGDQPDFSANGGMIQFGYTRSNTRTETLPPVPANQDLVYEHGIDNWTVRVFPQSAPPSNTRPVAVDDWVVYETDHTLGLDTMAILVLRNDSDPDGDTLSIADILVPPVHGGSASIVSGQSIHYTPAPLVYDRFTYTVSDGDLSNHADVTVLIDCGCVLDCLSSSSSVRPDGKLPDITLRSQPFSFQSLAPGVLETDSIDLQLIYRLREQVMKPTLHGSRYITMYYKTNPEILKILLIDSAALRAVAVATVALWQPNLRSLVDGDGSATITQAQIDAVRDFLANLSAAASPGLQKIIADELVRLGPLDAYIGLTVKEGRRRAIGDLLVYLPMMSKL